MPQGKHIVYLVDGTSYIYRAYHAIRNLTNSKGFPTNAAFGLTKMVLKLLAEKAPEYLAVVFDARGPTFRHEIYSEYKANRPPMPDEMAVQIPTVKDIVQKLGIMTIEKQGYEADDLIGTLARISENNGFSIVIVTGDKDFRQVVSDKTSLWDSMKDRITDYDSLKKDYGIEPAQFIDVMGLSGDSSDNIPGVPGVGEKTALNLIRQFGTIEGVYKHLDEVKGKKLKENLQNNREKALLSRKLVTIERFVHMDEMVKDLKPAQPDKESLSVIFRELEFKDLWHLFHEEKNAPTRYRACLSRDFLKTAVVEKIREKGYVSIDTETTSRDPLRAELVGLALSWEECHAVYIPVGHDYETAPEQLPLEEVLEILRDIIEDDAIQKIGQNIKYDAEVFQRYGLAMEGIHFDTMVASYVINPGLRQHGLDSLAQHYLNHKMTTYDELVGKGKTASVFSKVDIETATHYSGEDADITLRLKGLLSRKLKEDENEELFYDLEMALLPVLMDMEMTGVVVDTARLNKMSEKFALALSDIEKEIFVEAGVEFNINSPQQLGKVLFEKLKLPAQERTSKTKNYSTDVKVLKRLAALPHKVPELVLRYRTLSKLKSTYLDTLPQLVLPSTGRLHTSFNQTVAATGRLSSSNPNLQNIPVRDEDGRGIRKCFIAREGHVLVSADYSQVELRVLAHYSGDKAFIEAFREDEDIHRRTAADVFGMDIVDVTGEMRQIAKTINFGIIYGMGPKKLSDELGIDREEAKEYIDAYYSGYKGVWEYKESLIKEARENGYVTTLFNRRRYLPDIRHRNPAVRSESERMAVNTTIQGTAADLIKIAMINIHKRMRTDDFKAKLIIQVHDELIFEVPEKEVADFKTIVKREMEEVHTLKVPLKVDVGVGRNWNEAH